MNEQKSVQLQRLQLPRIYKMDLFSLKNHSYLFTNPDNLMGKSLSYCQVVRGKNDC